MDPHEAMESQEQYIASLLAAGHHGHLGPAAITSSPLPRGLASWRRGGQACESSYRRGDGRLCVEGHMSPINAVRRDKRMAREEGEDTDMPSSPCGRSHQSIDNGEDIMSWLTTDMAEEEGQEDAELDALLAKLQGVEIWRTQSTESVENDEKRSQDINNLVCNVAMI
mmetsp:Transcript_13982/g.21765  ORF Transcript_13982/g.21765 Transcript_13982/m.21765 type:complete len:168 (-) Transcript_13982:71-574(-)